MTTWMNTNLYRLGDDLLVEYWGDIYNIYIVYVTIYL